MSRSTAVHAMKNTNHDAVMSLAARANLLFVDDDQEVVKALRRELSTAGMEVDGCTSAEHALSLAREKQYSVFALDLCMPQMDGNALALELGRICPSASYVLVTGQRERDLPQQPPGAPPFVATLYKPWDLTQLLATIARAQATFEDRQRRASMRPTAGDLAAAPILLIEDNDADAELIQLLLQRSDLVGHAIVRVERLQAAVREMQGTSPSAIIADLTLPDARGLDAVVQLREVYPSVPMVVLSGLADDALAMQAVQEGAHEFLQKSELSTASLVRALRHAAGRTVATDELRQLAERDTLTGLLSRARFETALMASLLRAQREHSSLSLMYIDLDHFKQINDELGHAAGDEVLREAAKRIQASLRRNDLVARLGGDELVAILEDTDTAQAMELARRLQRSFAEPLALVPDRAIAASIGVASYPEDATSAEELLSRADEAMYRVKRLGRGEVASHGEQTGELQGLDEPSSCIESQIERGSVVARRRPLFSLSGQELDILEVEPALATSERISLDAETLRRLAAPSHLSLALHRRLFSLAEEVCRKEQRPALVTLSDAFCRANDDLASLCNRLARESSRVCVGLPQRFLQADPEHASDTITALRERGSRVFVADFGASGADVALISRLLGLDGLCLDGYLLRELSVERGRVQAFLDVVQSLGTSLSLEILVREQDRALCVRSPRSC